jgi:hypothetical protein
MMDCCGGMSWMMWFFMLAGAALFIALIVWIIKQVKK